MGDEKPKPIPGRCNAKTRGGGFCQRGRAKGKKRCRLHGGAPGSGRPIIHGLYSKKFRSTAEATAKSIQEALSDPDLLDMRRQVAVMQAIQYDMGIIPEDEELAELARTREQKDANEEANPGQILALRHKYLQKAAAMALDVQRSQQTVVRETNVKEMLGRAVAPLFARILERFTITIKHHVKSKKEQEAVLEAARREFRNTIVEVFQIGEDT